MTRLVAKIAAYFGEIHVVIATYYVYRLIVPSPPGLTILLVSNLDDHRAAGGKVPIEHI